ncbi:hypothetical protein [Streptomyces sp. SLBN-118]|uniref:hypothetical protein n=1 Tax=Streptomyces sp. SLBN-118 TaxID=2768454 RepID=UPI001356D077|nr:hypothetical protein [Streptomyces sp. SLBN-118]
MTATPHCSSTLQLMFTPGLSAIAVGRLVAVRRASAVPDPAAVDVHAQQALMPTAGA